MKNSGKVELHTDDELDFTVIYAMRMGYTDATNHIISEQYHIGTANFQKNYEIGRLYAVEIMALGLQPPPWQVNYMPAQMTKIVEAIQEYYKMPIVPTDKTNMPKE